MSFKVAPNPEYTRLVRNRSSREGTKPNLIGVHTTEGANRPGITDLVGLGVWFDNPAAEASSTISIDGAGNDARFCRDEDKPWTQAAVNRWTLSMELVGFASTTRDQWFEEHPHQLATAAVWIAYWSIKWDIPIRRGVAPAGVPLRSGVVSHKQLGIAGGGHVDPGPGFPFPYVLDLARYFKLKQLHPHSKPYLRIVRDVNAVRRARGLELVR